MSRESIMRLQKFLADCGVASRRKSEELISKGSIKVNGLVAKLGDKIDPTKDKITVKGKRIVSSKKLYYIMLHKPRGFVTTMNDELGRKCVGQLVSNIPARLFPIGRLDRDSEGLLLMTNDGEFANNVIHPSNQIPKKYRVTIKPEITEEQLAQFNIGIEIDGKKTMPADAWVILRQPGRVVLEIILYEGRNRQIRKMCEKVGVEVARLKRTAIGTVKLGMLPPGDYRDLTTEEIKKLTVKDINQI